MFEKGAKNTGERICFSINCVGKTGYSHAKKKWMWNPNHNIKFMSKWIKTIKGNQKVYTPRSKHKEKDSWLQSWEWFFF